MINKTSNKTSNEMINETIKKTVDTRGLLCPAPLIAVRKAIKAAEVGEIIEVLTDNDTAYSNLINYLSELSIKTTCTKRDFVHSIFFTKPELTLSNREILCPVNSLTESDADYTVVIKSELMGDGEPQLGAILLRGYLNALLELDQMPKNILLYNGGVKCAIEGSDTATSLKTLEERGVDITICGVCVDFYQLNGSINVGVIGNMYKIAETMAESSSVVYP